MKRTGVVRSVVMLVTGALMMGAVAQAADVPTVYLIGDSTVKNGRDDGSNGQWGWGHILPYYFDKEQATIANHAVGGTSSRSFYQNARMWGAVKEKLKAGDYVVMQFGHNDDTRPPESDTLRYRSTIKGNGEETVQGPVQGGGMETIHSYGWYIRQFIKETKEKGATPIVCSLIPRNGWKDGKMNRASKGYGLWAKEAAEQGGALFLPLNELIADKCDALGQEKVTATLFPEKETTHPNWAGSVINAACVAEGIAKLEVPVLKKALVKEPKVPSEPDVKTAARPATRRAATQPGN